MAPQLLRLGGWTWLVGVRVWTVNGLIDLGRIHVYERGHLGEAPLDDHYMCLTLLLQCHPCLIRAVDGLAQQRVSALRIPPAPITRASPDCDVDRRQGSLGYKP